MSRVHRNLTLTMIIVLLIFALPATVLAQEGGGHDHNPSADTSAPAAGPLSWAFLGFGAVIIATVSIVLFTGDRGDDSVKAADFDELTGFGGYIGKMRLFSRNARLYMVHIVGMDVIHGTWGVIFNLYLLASGFEIVFIGLRVLIASIATALFSIPAGVISDRIGRKLSFILGDGMGAAMSLIAISTGNRPLLLVTAAVAGMFGALHGVSEPAFMAENSSAFERVHLFSVAGGTRTASAIIGAALAGLFPLMLLGMADSASIIGLYRLVAYIGIGGWFASLIPALMLRPVELEAAQVPVPPKRGLLGGLFANVKHPDRIWKLVLPGILIGTGAGFVIPLMNVYFHEGLGSSEVEIGAIFAAGETFLAIASFLAPLVATRFGKVRSVVLSQLASLPFIVLLGLLPTLSGGVSTIFIAAVLAYIGRITFMNMASPIQSAFEMEILDPSERGTQVGIRMALGATVRGGAVFLGASLMQAGNFLAPFLVMATFYLIAVALFWYFFSGREEELVLSGQPMAA